MTDTSFNSSERRPTSYAEFLPRLAAYLIDGVILSLVHFALMAILDALGLSNSISLEALSQGDEPSEAALKGVYRSLLFSFSIVFVLQWLYFSILESSVRQATLGKKAMNIKVVDITGQRISFLRASARHFSRYLSSLILFIGFFMAAFTERKQALHDMIVSTLVVKE